MTSCTNAIISVFCMYCLCDIWHLFFLYEPFYVNCLFQVTDADVQRLREAVLPSPSAFLDDMQNFACIPRNINNEDTPLVCIMHLLHINCPVY